ncbi:MAG: MmcQ-like protein, partial [Verrucomicrobiaceae bacterium]|nr:MmcQ-like protein [Verrucomicrobiaceae bacterium]
MAIADFCEYCLSLPGAEETTPFRPEVLVYKVGGKMFALTSPDELPHSVNLKCEPERAVELRDRYEDITPCYHMNKRHWNTILLRGKVPSKLVREMIDHSYALVVASLPKIV